MKNFNLNLTARIFLITSALLIAVCAITYGAIAYLTPISYISILEDEQRREAEALVAELEGITPEETERFMASYTQISGANISIIDAAGDVLYGAAAAADSVGATEGLAPGTASGATTGIDTGTTSASNEPEGVGPITEVIDESIVEDTTIQVVHEGAVYEDVAYENNGSYPFTYEDGTAAILTLAGGQRAVNQAVEALGGVLPFLIGVILVVSLAGSFFYARFITRPIVSLSRIAGRMAKLDFDAQWTKRRGDEIGALGTSLNELSENLSRTLGELEAANAKLQRDIDRERALEKQRMAFFSAASHELKTPITILKGQLSGMLAQVGVYRDRDKYLKRALTVTGRMEGLVKEILTLNRIGAGDFALQAKRIDLAALMEKQIALDDELIEQKGLSLKAEITLDTWIRGDEALLLKALDNVLINAVLYSPPDAEIHVEVKDRGFSVENTGVTIPEEALKELFTPFYRVEQSRNRKSGGSGLGLYLVKSILDLHGASCRMENTDRGVLFTARFPDFPTP